MSCSFSSICGGCSFRDLALMEYRQQKIKQVQNVLQLITRRNFSFSNPIFIADGARRRAAFTFARRKGNLVLGFNAAKSAEIVDIDSCLLLTPKLNSVLPIVRNMLKQICDVEIVSGNRKNRKITRVDKGDVWVTEAENGIDVVLEFNAEPNLDMRQIIFEVMSAQDTVIRVSHRKDFGSPVETLIEKIKPYISIAGRNVYIPAGTFLQPSKAGEQALIGLVLKYLDGVCGNIADLFCGVGTFSYAISQLAGCHVTAVDSSAELLSGFKDSLNRQMIANVEIQNRNLFKYPLVDKELAGFTAIVFDPPRAGAKEQVRAIVDLPAVSKPQKIVAVSCNPETFVRDAEILNCGGYELVEVTMVDQFIYSPHCELVAMFNKI